ncbi:uncharacterized protein TRIADDRAFT_50856 [Trichoplax adhaerens]|uniref:(S)-2-hydroxy-acid oxidase n=1 Tax=Trichoplax adhaerens TaxID=10228 RepID=B3S7T5_TRIAD|nr:hypothetical protein TRIADDRAFT_50856 [Trichoplax adhaerens]EDV21349.1 hypothetical protein TRIADDRAFT_50856 [Trichoplax adhaerens]|eukprot:XP_002116316.1 hypothetical protein TRIADDRAFT_50856 [Trichoplax adhaerens]
MQPLCIRDIEQFASENLSKNALSYYNVGADDEETLRDNVEIFKRIRIRPRMLIDVTNVDLSTTILGRKIEMPIGISPTAMQKLAHPDGEIATAQAAKFMKTCMTLSTYSTTSIEDVGVASGDGLRWFQLYVSPDRELTRNFVHRAERSGFKALVVTVDVPVAGNRRKEIRQGFDLPPHLHLANFSSNSFKGVDTEVENSGWSNNYQMQIDGSITWESISWLQTITSLQVIVKGILTAEDASEAIRRGIKAIWISNHGGRQLDGVPTAIEVLPEIVEAVKEQAEIYVDGGFRLGTDVFKALALGARAVFIGRPILWGLCYNGSDGVKKVLQLLKEELQRTMQLAGCTSIGDITPSSVIYAINFSKI